jgi:hypothetical protein
LGKTLLKQVPLLGDVLSAASALKQALAGDFRGAVREAISAIPVIGTVVDVAETLGKALLDKGMNLLDKVRQDVEQRLLQDFLNNEESLVISKSLDPEKLQPRPTWSPPRPVRQIVRLLVWDLQQPSHPQSPSHPAVLGSTISAPQSSGSSRECCICRPCRSVRVWANQRRSRTRH